MEEVPGLGFGGFGLGFRVVNVRRMCSTVPYAFSLGSITL